MFTFVVLGLLLITGQEVALAQVDEAERPQTWTCATRKSRPDEAGELGSTPRTWTDRSGVHKLKSTLLDRGREGLFAKGEWRRATIPISNLSVTDQELVKMRIRGPQPFDDATAKAQRCGENIGTGNKMSESLRADYEKLKGRDTGGKATIAVVEFRSVRRRDGLRAAL